MGLAAATAAFGLGAALPVATAAQAAVDSPPTDFHALARQHPGKQKALLDMREPNGGMAMAWAWVFLFTAPQAYGITENDVGGGDGAAPQRDPDRAGRRVRGASTSSASSSRSTTRDTGAPAVRNPYYPTMVDPFLPDMALQKLIDRGVKVAACDMAIHSTADSSPSRWA